eukprot:scaffold2083_cov113-Skeletonema_marinoi.AAC.17
MAPLQLCGKQAAKSVPMIGSKKFVIVKRSPFCEVAGSSVTFMHVSTSQRASCSHSAFVGGGDAEDSR